MSRPTVMFPLMPAAAPDPRRLRRALLSFYDRQARDLPWRRTSDPYRIWVSETMLQQTRVETVVPYYEAWLRRFPSLESLADAEEAHVLRAWAGLGYYSRARNLHRAARAVRERHGGTLPADPAQLRALPGIGAYTAGAVASIAFGRREPAVDGNVKRVLARIYDLRFPTPSELRRRAAGLVPARRPGDFNQALMELGATVCTARAPACHGCPVAAECLARARGTQARRPPPLRRPRRRHDHVATAALIAPGGRLLLMRRPAGGLLGGLWELPGVPVEAEADPMAACRSFARVLAATDQGAACGARSGAEGSGAPERLSEEAGGNEAAHTPRVLEPLVHTFTHRRTTYHPVPLRVRLEFEPRLRPWGSGGRRGERRAAAGSSPGTGSGAGTGTSGATGTSAATGRSAGTGSGAGTGTSGATESSAAPASSAATHWTGWSWVSPAELDDHALPAAQRLIALRVWAAAT